MRYLQRWPYEDSASVGPETPDLSPSFHWPHPPAASELDRDRGPVLVTVEYEMRLARREAFLDAIQQLGTIRRRDGAFGWGISRILPYQDDISKYSSMTHGSIICVSTPCHTRRPACSGKYPPFPHWRRSPQGFTFHRRRAQSTHGSFTGNRLMRALPLHPLRVPPLSFFC